MTQVMLSPWRQHSPCQPQLSWPLFPASPHPSALLTVARSSMGSGISTKLATR